MSTELASLGIVLRRSDSGESDRRLTLLTRDFGKLDVVAKGARKGGSRLAGSSEPLVEAKFAWAEGKYRRFVTQVEPVSSFPGLRADYDRMMVGLALAEVVGASLEYETPVEEAFDLLETGLKALGGEEAPLAVLVWGLVRLLVAEGQNPEWTSCVVSGERLAVTPAAVSAQAGGFVCPEMSGQFEDVRWVSAEALIALEKCSVLDAPPVRIKRAGECAETLWRFWQGILNRRLGATETAIRETFVGSE